MLPTPNPNALRDIPQYEQYDAQSFIPVDTGRVTFNYYPGSGIAHVGGGVLGGTIREYNFRLESVYKDEAGLVALEEAGRARELLAERGITTVEGYPEVDEIIDGLQQITPVPHEDLLREEHTHRWFITKTIPPSNSHHTARYHLMRLAGAQTTTTVYNRVTPVVCVEREALGPRMPTGTIPVSLELCYDNRPKYLDETPTRRHTMKFDAFARNRDGGHYPESGAIVEERIDTLHAGGLPVDVIFYPVDEAAANKLMEMRAPVVDLDRFRLHGREQRAVIMALQSLQFKRWSEWDVGDIKDFDSTMSEGAYTSALTTLIDRFGEDFFLEVSWDLMLSHLKNLHTDDMTKGLIHKPHTDIGPHGGLSGEIARALIGESHPIARTMEGHGYVVNALPLYGDVAFWRALHARYPSTYQELSNRWLSLPDEFEAVGTYGVSVLNPRAVLAEHFPEAYTFLQSRNPRFVAALGAMSVRYLGHDDREMT